MNAETRKRTSRHFPVEPMALYYDNQRSPHTAKNSIIAYGPLPAGWSQRIASPN